MAQIRAHNLRDVKRDRTLVRGSKHAFDYYTQFQNSGPGPSEKMKGLCTDMFSKCIGGVFPGEIRPCF